MNRPDKDKAPKRATLKTVAARAGVSQSTVSFVLNGMEEMRISEETRKRVLDAAYDLGYRRRGAGRPLTHQGVERIGLMFNEIATSPFAAISIEGMQEEAWKSNIVIEVVMTRGDKAYENAILRQWNQDPVRGVVYASILTREVDPPDGLSLHKAVLLNCHDKVGRLDTIVPAERRGGRAATQALIDAGHQRIAFISGEPWMEASEQRREGYEQALMANDMAIDPALIEEGNFLTSGGYDATLKLLAGKHRPDAIFCANDLTAIGCYMALKENGERIGETIAVMGYDDQEIAQNLKPSLSTVLLPHREMGHWCVQQILGKESTAPEKKRIACPLILRESHLASRI